MDVCSVSCNVLSGKCQGRKLEVEKRDLRCSVKCEDFFCHGNAAIKIGTDLIISYYKAFSKMCIGEPVLMENLLF